MRSKGGRCKDLGQIGLTPGYIGNGAFRRFLYFTDEVEKGCLSGPVVAQNANQFPRFYSEFNVVQQRVSAVSEVKVIYS